MFLSFYECLACFAIVIAIQTLASPVPAPSVSTETDFGTSQSQNSTGRCGSHDTRWINPCHVNIRHRRDVSRVIRRKIEGLQYYINDTIKHYIAEAYFDTGLMQDLEANQETMFNRTFNNNSPEMEIENSIRQFIANIEVLSNCGMDSLADSHLNQLLDELITRFYSALCSLDILDRTQDVISPEKESMVLPKVHQFLNTQNGLSQAINVYFTLGDIESVLGVMKQRYFI